MICISSNCILGLANWVNNILLLCTGTALVLHLTAVSSALPPPPIGKNPTRWLVGQVIPSNHKGHTCEWCLLDFHTKEPRQASINGGRAAELCSDVPSLCPSHRWVNKDEPVMLRPHAVWAYPRKHLLTYSSRLSKIVWLICWSFGDFCLWNFCHRHNAFVIKVLDVLKHI